MTFNSDCFVVFSFRNLFVNNYYIDLKKYLITVTLQLRQKAIIMF